MNTRLLRRASAGALALTLIDATAAISADLQTDAVLGVSAVAATEVMTGTNSFDIKISATGRLPSDKTGKAKVSTRYFMSSTGAITASSSPSDMVELSFIPGYHYGQCATQSPSNALGCASNPFVVPALLIVATETPAATAGTLTVLHSGSDGLIADSTPDIGYVEVGGVINTPPSAPANVLAAPATSQGAVLVSWGMSTDEQADEFTYTLEGRDASTAVFSVIASGLTTTSHAFAIGEPAEGTWTFRVKAVETSTSPSLESEYSSDSNAAVVDRTAPNAPIASPSRVADYVEGNGVQWWADAVDVSFTGDGDPLLADGSVGSGVNSTTGPIAITAPGPFSVDGTATDLAGNASQPTTFAGAVDTDYPQLTVTCPTMPVYFGDTAYATWTATDGGSGVSGATSGSLPIATTAAGSVVVGTEVSDNVGHRTSNTATCPVLNWTAKGFYAPVDMGGVWNTVKAGSTVPLKFEVFKGDTEITDVSKVSITKATIACTSGLTDAIETLATSTTTGLRYDFDGGQFIENWKTPKGSTACYAVTMTAVDGSTFTAKFQLK